MRRRCKIFKCVEIGSPCTACWAGPWGGRTPWTRSRRELKPATLSTLFSLNLCKCLMYYCVFKHFLSQTEMFLHTLFLLFSFLKNLSFPHTFFLPFMSFYSTHHSFDCFSFCLLIFSFMKIFNLNFLPKYFSILHRRLASEILVSCMYSNSWKNYAIVPKD